MSNTTRNRFTTMHCRSAPAETAPRRVPKAACCAAAGHDHEFDGAAALVTAASK
ncbi:hypothetical protein [Burkholderia perseverans]|uniref:hypothetical protein n=1 Tax=Burkholderia perseverans TaxID=2615214 RepID=UPI001FEE3737|nr:hypothetical protein [Burkholderia perseverans]